jgi:glycosyltransferase involved in cell wall biosynthesis
LRDVLTTLKAHPELRAELAARGRQRVLEHFTQARVALATYRVYQDMIAGGSSVVL